MLSIDVKPKHVPAAISSSVLNPRRMNVKENKCVACRSAGEPCRTDGYRMWVGALLVLGDEDKEKGRAGVKSAAANGRRIASCGWGD